MDQDHFLDLLNKQIQGKLSPDEKKLLEQLIDDNPYHEVLYKFVSNSRVSSTEAAQADRAFADTWQRIQETESGASENRFALERVNPLRNLGKQAIKRSYPFYFAVACLLMVLFIGILWYSTQYKTSTYGIYYSSAKGEKRILSLPDGSTVWLNGDSKLYLATDFNKRERRVKLVGEGFFSVVKDKKHPFVVSYKNAEVKVLGTKFNIRAYPDESKVQTSLVEGAIEMTSQKDGHVFSMAPGEKITIPSIETRSDRSEKGQIGPVRRTSLKVQEGQKLPSEILWLENKLSFDADPMSIVVSKIGKWYNKSISIENPELEKTTFTGTMEGFSLDKVLKTIVLANPGIHLKYDNESIILY